MCVGVSLLGALCTGTKALAAPIVSIGFLDGHAQTTSDYVTGELVTDDGAVRVQWDTDPQPHGVGKLDSIPVSEDITQKIIALNLKYEKRKGVSPVWAIAYGNGQFFPAQFHSPRIQIMGSGDDRHAISVRAHFEGAGLFEVEPGLLQRQGISRDVPTSQDVPLWSEVLKEHRHFLLDVNDGEAGVPIKIIKHVIRAGDEAVEFVLGRDFKAMEEAPAGAKFEELKVFSVPTVLIRTTTEGEYNWQRTGPAADALADAATESSSVRTEFQQENYLRPEGNMMEALVTLRHPETVRQHCWAHFASLVDRVLPAKVSHLLSLAR